MELPIQIEQISVARAANAAHFEYMSTVLRRVTEVRISNPLWRQAVTEFNEAFDAEDKAFKLYRSSELTEPLRVADEERDKLYASLRDAVKTFAKFTVGTAAEHAAPLKRVLDNYRIRTDANYMRESGLIENMLQDLLPLRDDLEALGLWEVADELKEKNEEVRRLLADRNEERMAQIAGQLKAARQVCDGAYAAVVFYTNAFYAMNPTARDAEPLVLRMREDLEYFRQHSMSDPNHNKKSSPTGETPAQQETPEDGNGQ